LVKPMQVLIAVLLEFFKALPVDPPAPTVRFDLFPRSTQVLRLVHLVNQRVHLPFSVRIEPVGQFPRRLTEGFFRSGTGPCHRLTHWPHHLAPVAFADGLPRSTPPPFAGRAGYLCPHFRYCAVLRLLTEHRPPLHRFGL